MKEPEHEQLHSVIEEKYRIGSVLSFAPLANAGQNGAFRLETTSGLYFLRQYRVNIKGITVANEAPLIDLLANTGLPVPKVIRNSAGELVSQNRDERSFIIQEHIQGDLYPSEGTQLNTEQIANAAKALARFHKIMQEENPALDTPADIEDYTTERFFSVSTAVNVWNNALTIISNKGDVDPVDIQIITIAPQKLEAIAEVDEAALNMTMRRMPSILAHGDYIPQNIIFRANEVVGIIDWELARRQPRIWELLRALCSFCKTDTTEIFNTPLDIKKAKIFLGAYESVNSLKTKEQETMFYLAYLASLFPHYLLSARYINRETSVDRLIPKDISHWTWWQNNIQKVQKEIFDL